MKYLSWFINIIFLAIIIYSQLTIQDYREDCAKYQKAVEIYESACDKYKQAIEEYKVRCQ